MSKQADERNRAKPLLPQVASCLEAFFSALALILSTALAVISISEITTRQDLCKILEERSNNLAKQQLALNPQEVQFVGEQPTRQELESDIRYVQYLHTELRALMI